ncbi:MAG: amino acid adenylation domain-containing protein [Cyanobacteria bacterium CRU_2_1]|nr:amino acid adenylation domain-containing protein [Cyanobacteria bacterium CRU_2_1]
MSRPIVEFLAHLKSLDVQVSVEGDRHAFPEEMRLRCTAPEGTLTPELRRQLADRKAELLAFLHPMRSQPIHSLPPIQPIAIQPAPQNTVFPLSFAQQRLWFLYQLAPNNPFYNVPAAIRLKGTLDQTALERSFNEIVHRHATLRTTFTMVDGQPVQVIAPEVTIALPIVELQLIPAAERDRITQQFATAEAQRPFNLSTDSPLRITLLQFHPTESVLLLTLHHIVADGWSLGVLVRELACFYTAFVEGKSPTLAALPIQYADFACWQRNGLQGEVLENQLAYWRSQLREISVLDLPTDRPRPAIQTYRGATYPIHYSSALTQALEALSQQEGVSLFMTLLAAFQTLLYRYTGQEDIAIGSPVANRHRSELEGLIGFFVNSLVLRTDLSGNPTVRELLGRVREVALEAYMHQDLPFEKLVEELDPERDLSRNPLFQVAFALQNAPMQPLALPGITLEPTQLESATTRFDLEIHLWEPAHGLRSLWQSQEGLSGFVSYSTDLFDRPTMSRLVGHFQTLLEGIVANPDARLSDLPLLTLAEHQQIWVEWNQTDRKYATDRCFHQIFEAQAQQCPEAIALVSEQGSFTYEELNQRGDRLARTLRQMGIHPDCLVGLCVDRSADMMIGILGILKAGGAYVPLDPNYPRDRLHFMLIDSQVPILLTQSWLVDTLPASQAQILCLDQPLDSRCNPDRSLNPSTMRDFRASDSPQKGEARRAYVIYTSGSTGTPKGVLITHRGLCNVVEAQRQVFHLPRESRILQFSSLSFDASVFEMALALGSGGTLYIPPKSAQLPGIALLQFLQDNAITHALLTPSVLTVLPSAELPALQTLITGGEACSHQVVDRWAANRQFFNAYGPTETTIWATIAQLHPGDNPLAIGRPVANTQVYILDTALNPVPVGIAGELHISGEGLASGYLNRPDLTTERFISAKGEESFNSAPQTQHSKLYKTGDRARYRADGTIEFLGRIDTQIKIRGFRVELGEIEATLKRHPAIQDAVTIASGKASGDLRLIAYFSFNHQQMQQAKLEQSLQSQQIQHWQTLYNQTYHSGNAVDSDFDITGWNSSYTGQPIPAEQMHEWVDDRVQQILALNPQRVLEIGCGTGLLLFQIAPHCQEYWGTDFSTVSLDSIQRQLDDCHLRQVKLLHRMATDFEGIDSAAFDVVVLNSVVQYFPSLDYLMQVLEGAIQAVAPGGVLFLGDVRSLPLLTAFHSWVQFSQVDAGLERPQLRQQVERSRFEEPELAIDPAFFYALRDRFPQIHWVQIRLPRGRSQNEMTQFRYHGLLHMKGGGACDDPRSRSSIQWLDWLRNPVAVADIQNHLLETQPEVFGITNIANGRVNAAVKTADWLFHQTSPKTVGRMREALQNSAQTAIDPQDWWDLETVLPYRVEISWSMQAQRGNYDVLFIRHGVTETVDRFLQQQPLLQQQPSQSWSHYTNDPLQSQFARQLMPELRQYLGQTLPDYMVPSAFVPLETLPLTPNGKVDRASVAEQYRCAFPSVDAVPISPPSTIVAPRTLHEAKLTQTESTLADIWKELLRLKQVSVDDNFFELGGHSLLATQMTSRVRDAFEIEMPLQSVFETPTIAQLAPVIETLRETMSTKPVPALVRLDRAAHRRLRSSLNGKPAHSQTPQDLPPHEPPSSGSSQVPAIAQLTSHFDKLIAKPDLVTEVWSPLVPLTLGGNRQPFFCVHPMFGVVFPYLELAHHLGDRSFYGLQPLGLDGKHPPFNQIEAMATYYIQAIQTVQPHGAYFLGGWSFGGLIAFEMAQQLTQAGQQVALLAIFDTPAPVTHTQPSLCQNLKFLLRTAIWSAMPFLLDYSAIATLSQPLKRSQPQQAGENNHRRWKTWFLAGNGLRSPISSLKRHAYSY